MPFVSLHKKQRQRILDVYRTFRLLGIQSDQIEVLEAEHHIGNLHSEATIERIDGYRSIARLAIELSGLDSDRYIKREPIDVPISSDLPESLVGVMAVLGTTERSLEELEFDAPMKLRTREIFESETLRSLISGWQEQPGQEFPQ